jgi:hypothetical protein
MHVATAAVELARVMAPGADLWVTLHSWRQTAREMADALRSGRPKNVLYRAAVAFSGVALHVTGRQLPVQARQRRYESFQTERSIRRALRAAGLVDIGVRTDRFFVVTASKPRR